MSPSAATLAAPVMRMRWLVRLRHSEGQLCGSGGWFGNEPDYIQVLICCRLRQGRARTGMPSVCPPQPRSRLGSGGVPAATPAAMATVPSPPRHPSRRSCESSHPQAVGPPAGERALSRPGDLQPAGYLSTD